MAKRGPKTKGPQTPLQWEEFEKLCAMQCTKNELASWYDCHIDTLVTRVEEYYEAKFSIVYEERRSVGKISLRRAQWEKAVEKKSVPMLIWLGKQYLQQSDKESGGSGLEDLVFTSSIGEGGQIIQEIKTSQDWEAQKTYNVKDSLQKIKEEATKRLEDQSKKKKMSDEKPDKA